MSFHIIAILLIYLYSKQGRL